MTLSAANSPISSTLDLITPAWSCPANVVAYTTTRMGGTSIGDFAGLNVGAHVGDDLLLVKANRSLIPHSEKITWLEQVHSNRVVSLPSADTTADASYSSSTSHFCAVMTADCVTACPFYCVMKAVKKWRQYMLVGKVSILTLSEVQFHTLAATQKNSSLGLVLQSAGPATKLMHSWRVSFAI